MTYTDWLDIKSGGSIDIGNQGMAQIDDGAAEQAAP